MNRLKSTHFKFDMFERSCGLTFSPPIRRFCVIFSLCRTFEKDDVSDLVKAASEIAATGKEEGICGSWTVVKDSMRDIFYIEFRGMRIFLGVDEINEFLRLVGQLSMQVGARTKDA